MGPSECPKEDVKPLSILLADDFPVERRGMRALLESQPGWKVVAEAGNGWEAVDLARKLQPDLVIIDPRMPELNGLVAARVILESLPETRLLVLTAYWSEETIAKALQVGASGYMLKSDTETDLVNAINAVAAGRAFFTPAVSEAVAGHLHGRRKGGLYPILTPRESQIVQLLAQGKSNKEVADMLGISSRTAEKHRAQIMRRLRLQSFSELVRYAVRNGLVEP